jgi:3D (Asp-Asp-Asp) domain-containing protein
MSCTGFPVLAKGVALASNDQPTPAKPTKTLAKTVTDPDKTKSTVAGVSASAKDKVTPKVASTSTTSRDNAKPMVAKTSTSAHSTLQTRQGSVATTRNHSATIARSDAKARLARVTAYWAGEGDYYTGKCLSSTGIHLHDGHCAVDPRIIPYGSVVEIAGVGKYVAVDTGSAVISREAAREAAHTTEERNALVIDLFFESRRDGERFAANGPKYAAISWTTPMAAGNTSTVSETHSLIADENSGRTSNKQL